MVLQINRFVNKNSPGDDGTLWNKRKDDKISGFAIYNKNKKLILNLNKKIKLITVKYKKKKQSKK